MRLLLLLLLIPLAVVVIGTADQPVGQEDPGISSPEEFLSLVAEKTAAGRPFEATRILDEALQRFPENEDLLLAGATRAISRNDYDTALKMAEEVVSLNGSSTMAWLMIGRVLAHEARYEQAGVILEEAVARDPGNITALISLAYVANRAGLHEKALEAVDRTLTLDPGNPDLINARAYTLYLQGDLDTAEKEVREVLAANPDHAASLDTIGAILIGRGEYAAALDYLKRALRGVPADEEVAGHLGDAYFGLGELELAQDWYQRAVLQDPSYIPGICGYAKVLTSLKRYPEAAAALRQALALTPGEPDLIAAEKNVHAVLLERYIRKEHAVKPY